MSLRGSVRSGCCIEPGAGEGDRRPAAKFSTVSSVLRRLAALIDGEGQREVLLRPVKEAPHPPALAAMWSDVEERGFTWVTNAEPHATRRREVLAKHGEQVRALYGYDNSTAVQVQSQLCNPP